MKAPQSVRKTCNHGTSPAARGSSSTFALHSNYFASCSQSWLNRSDSSTQPPPAARHASSTPAVPGRSAAHTLNAAFRRLGLTADVLELRPKIAWRSMPPLPGERLLTVLTLPALEWRPGATTLAQTEVVFLPGLSSSQTKRWQKQGFSPAWSTAHLTCYCRLSRVKPCGWRSMASSLLAGCIQPEHWFSLALSAASAKQTVLLHLYSYEGAHILYCKAFPLFLILILSPHIWNKPHHKKPAPFSG